MNIMEGADFNTPPEIILDVDLEMDNIVIELEPQEWVSQISNDNMLVNAYM